VTIGSNLTASGTETSACGSSQACTYAQVAPLPSGDTATGGLTSPIDGVVTRWRIKSGSAGNPVSLRILRPTGAGAFTAVGTSGTEATVADTAQFNAQLPIKAGDYLGIDNANSALIFAPTAGASIYRWAPPLGNGSNRVADGTLGTLELMVQADVEPDADCDGLGDETQDTNTADGPCAPHPVGGGGGGGGGGGTADLIAPTITSLAIMPRKPRARHTLSFRYTTSEAGQATLTVERCAKTKKKRCTRWRVARTLRQNAATGANKVAFKPRRAGRYRATLVTADAAKNFSQPRRITFRVRPRR
jgi:hypothetical protein